MARILIVDDTPENVYLLDVVLKGSGFETKTAANGMEALEQARSTPPDLIISDIFMPVMDGFSFLRECKQDDTLREVPFVFYTATYTAEKDQAFARDLGADLILIKPVDPVDLVASIRGLLERRGKAPPPARPAAPLPEPEFLKGYSETVVRKLEEKVRELDDANRALSTSEHKYHRLFEDSILGIFQSTPKGRYTMVNPAMARMLGYDSPQDMIDAVADIGQQLYRDRRDRERAGRVLAETGVLLGFIAPFRHQDGRTIWLSVNSRAARREDGTVEYYEGTAEDITEWKETQKQLDSSRDMEASILNAIPLAVIGLKNRRITFANDDTTRVFGWRPEELIGRSNLVLYRSEEEFRRIGDMVYQPLGTEKTSTVELEALCRHKDGKEMLCRLKAARIGERLSDNQIVATYEDVTELVETKERLGQTYERLQRTLSDMIRTISSLLEAKDPYTAGHQERVSRLVTAIAREMNLPEDDLQALGTAALLHDLGKMHIPSDILSKPGRLSEMEYRLVQIHPQEGYEIIRNIDFAFPIAEMIFQHHERLDGSGYPRGLSGDEILREARIIAVADVVEAMSSHRPYRPALGIEAALEEITEHRGILYDDAVVDACRRLFREKAFRFE